MKYETIVAGDIHARWGPVNTMLQKKKPKILLQCGDYGWWPELHNTKALSTNGSDLRRRKPWNQYGLKNGNTKVYWCDGNHEDHWSLEGLLEFDNRPEIQPNVFYMRRGSTLVLPDGRTVLFMGGASSIDKNSRILGFDWFPQEEITHSDMMNLPDKEIDIVISHTCSLEILHLIESYKIYDYSMKAMSQIIDRYQPKLWYFGHFHQFKTGMIGTTRWYTLGMVPETMWWIPLEAK